MCAYIRLGKFLLLFPSRNVRPICIVTYYPPMMYSTYLLAIPPEVTIALNVLKMMVLKMLCGDFNARCSDTDAPLCPTNLPVRSYTDNAPSNSYGTSLIEFMIECDICMLNGRFGDNSNTFTCVSTKGASVVY